MFTLCLVDVSTTRTYAHLRSSFPRCRRRLALRCPSQTQFPSPAPWRLAGRAAPPMDSFFIDALVRASLCRHHSSFLPAGRPRTHTHTPYPRAYTTTTTDAPPPYSPEVKTELKSFSDPYYDPDLDPTPDPPHPTHPNDPKAALRPPLPWSVPTNPKDRALLRRFTRQLSDPGVTRDLLYRTYRELPAPPILHLHLHQINAFVARMMTVPQRTEPAMLRYLAVLDDLRAENIPISRPEYNAAISFVARSFAAVTPHEARAALNLWKMSEAAPAAQGSDITTFNILLDMAARCDAPVLVEWVLREIDARDIPADRFTHTTLITYHGLRGDAAGATRAYRRLVDAGEIVDTVVLNAVMAAFLRAGQPQSAEYIYENMKRATLEPPPPGTAPPQRGPDDWVGKRRWAKHLKAVAERRRRIIGGYMKEFNASLAPDVYTSNMVVLLAAKSGDYERAMELVAEMDPLGVKLDETVVVALLKGFYWFGGLPNTPWTAERLEGVLAMALDAQTGVRMERSLARWVLMSTARVYNSRERVKRVWARVRVRLEECGGEVEEDTIEVLRGLVGHETV